MSVFFAKRVTALVITLMLTTVVIFLVLEILPGDPASLMLGINAEADTLAALRAELGLDRPVLVRYTSWVLDLLQGNLGTSLTYDVPVSELIIERIAISLPLALMAILLSTVIAIPMGIIAASNHN
ncbi:MAG: ABC transporter permease, partial [Deltaproteobacteria bacterium]|nr:ABC transporter permease [Deltaproteobacteria bacterium]